MDKYFVQWKYASSLGGPWMQGDQVELDEATAQAINVDSPGVLALSPPKPEKTSASKGKNRMVVEANTRLEGTVMSGEWPGYGAELLPGKED